MEFNITSEEQSAIRKKMEEITKKLANHEHKGHWIAGVNVGNYFLCTIKDRRFIVALTEVFKKLIFDVLPEATIRFPKQFGQYNSDKVIEALSEVAEIPYADFFKKEKFAYVFEVKNNVQIGDILRIDLYRKIGAENDKTEFIGGIFHGYKHFSFKGTPLSTNPTKNELSKPSELIEIIIKAFFITNKVDNNLQSCKKNGFETNGIYKNKYNLQATFYFEEVSETYFLTRIGPRGKSKNG